MLRQTAAADNLTKVTDANGHATAYAYDKGGNLISETDALGNTVRYRYTPEGWLSTITKADGTTISYEYDKTGNVTKESASDGTVTNHEYNAIGELVTTESDEGVTKYQYNSKGYLAYVVNPGGEVVSYTYDDYGRKAALKYPDGKTVSYTYDEMDRMTGVTGLDGDTTTYTYDAAGRRVATKNSTLETTYAYDAVGNLTKQQTTGKTEISFEYVYNLNNGITEETRVENGNAVKSAYTYDALGQLTSFVKSDGHEESYAYDKTGNMLEKVLNTTKIAMTYDAANELRTMESVNGKIDYTYDANGNLTQKMLGSKTDTYTYDSYNQLTSYKGYDGYQQRYVYNAQGHMIRKESKGNGNRQTLEEIVRGDEAKQAASDGGDGDDDPDPYAGKSASNAWQVTTYLYDVTAPYYEVLAETTDGKTTTYDYGVERLAAHTGGSWNAQKTEYVYDGRGSVAQEVSYNNSWYTFGGKLGKASIVSKSYSPFGEQLGVATSGYGFNGEQYDSATGMLNLRARQYEPAMGRFSQKDSWRGYATMGLSQNRFAYCVNDPVNLYDHGGNRFDEGGASVARNMRNGMSAAAAVAKSNQSQAKVQSAANKAAETRAKRDYYWLNTSVNNYNEEQRAEQQSIRRADSAARAFNAALGGVDRSKLSSEQQTTLDAAEKELRDKALKGTLTEAEKNSLINTACRAASDGFYAAVAPSTTPFPLPMPGPSPEIPGYSYDPSKFDSFWRDVTKAWNSLEIEVSFGFGLGASIETPIVGGSALARSDFLVIKLDDGKFDIGRRQSAEAGYTLLFGNETAYAQDYDSFITGETAYGERGVSRTIPIAEIGGYLIVGGQAGIRINPDEFFGLQP